MNISTVAPFATTQQEFSLAERPIKTIQESNPENDSSSYSEDIISFQQSSREPRESVRNIEDAFQLVGQIRSDILRLHTNALTAHTSGNRTGLADLLTQ